VIGDATGATDREQGRERAREAALERAGWNVLNLDPRAVEIDLLTDVPREPAPVVAERAAASPGDVDAAELASLAEALYGPARYLFTTKGRAAELALSAALAPRLRGAHVLTNGLFRTTQRSVEVRGAAVLVSPLAARGSSAIDLDWAGARMAEHTVAAVYMELASNARAGWPVDLDGLRAVRRLCDERGALLVVDATRGLANARSLGLDPVPAVRAAAGLADAFAVSCAKELLVPGGALVGLRDLALQRAAWLHAFEEGTLLETPGPRRLLAEGLRELAARPGWIDRRARQIAMLAGELGRLGVPLVEPAGAHALYVQLDPAAAPGPHDGRALEALLYLVSGARTLVHDSALLGGRVARLAVGLGRHTDDSLRRAAAGVAEWRRRADEAPALTPEPSECLHEAYFARYRRV